MKGLFWILGAFALAVGLSLALRAAEGYALLVLPPYRIELSLALLAIVLLAGFVAAYFTTLLLSHTLRLPGHVRAFRERRRSNSAESALLGALQAWFEGRFSRAEKFAAKAWELGASPAAVSLVAARAAQRVRDNDRRDLWLQRADEASSSGKGDSKWRHATLATRGELLIEQRRFDEARTVLRGLHATGPTQIATLLLLLRAEQALGEWHEVIRIARLLEKRSGLPAAALEGIVTDARLALLERMAQDPKSLAEYWSHVPEGERCQSKLAAVAARTFIQLGDCRGAHRIIEEALGAAWTPELVLVYGECLDDDALARIEQAERWLNERPRDWPLLLTLGRLCAQRKLWGKAQSYLEASLAMQPTRAAHVALAQLFDQIGWVHDANRHYRAAADVGLPTGQA